MKKIVLAVVTCSLSFPLMTSSGLAVPYDLSPDDTYRNDYGDPGPCGKDLQESAIKALGELSEIVELIDIDTEQGRAVLLGICKNVRELLKDVAEATGSEMVSAPKKGKAAEPYRFSFDFLGFKKSASKSRDPLPVGSSSGTASLPFYRLEMEMLR